MVDQRGQFSWWSSFAKDKPVGLKKETEEMLIFSPLPPPLSFSFSRSLLAYLACMQRTNLDQPSPFYFSLGLWRQKKTNLPEPSHVTCDPARYPLICGFGRGDGEPRQFSHSPFILVQRSARSRRHRGQVNNNYTEKEGKSAHRNAAAASILSSYIQSALVDAMDGG